MWANGTNVTHANYSQYYNQSNNRNFSKYYLVVKNSNNASQPAKYDYGKYYNASQYSGSKLAEIDLEGVKQIFIK